MDMSARLAKLRADKAAEKSALVALVAETVVAPALAPAVQSTTAVATTSAPPPDLFTAAAMQTVSIDHMDFLSKMNALQEAIHTRHPTMPVLLFQIHEHLKKDPEIVTLLSEEAIGVVVKGLEIQTKTELVSVVVKQSKAKDKKTSLSADMF